MDTITIYKALRLRNAFDFYFDFKLTKTECFLQVYKIMFICVIYRSQKTNFIKNFEIIYISKKNESKIRGTIFMIYSLKTSFKCVVIVLRNIFFKLTVFARSNHIKSLNTFVLLQIFNFILN